MIDLESIFKKNDGEYLKFEKVEDKLSSRRDLCAFLLLEKLVPNKVTNIVTGADHGIIYLNVNMTELATKAAEDQIITLIRCGIHYDSDLNCLAIIV